MNELSGLDSLWRQLAMSTTVHAERRIGVSEAVLQIVVSKFRALAAYENEHEQGREVIA